MAGVLCIDLGSSYTKLAVRPDWNEKSHLIMNELDNGEIELCLPSLVARVDRKNRTQWLTGFEAQNLVPGDGVVIYQDWKAQIFSPNSGTEYDDVANHFFLGIKRHLTQLGYDKTPSAYKTRLCIPKLKGSREVGMRLKGLAEANGFKFTDERPCVYEPETNVCGLLTRGQNATWKPKPWEDLHPNYRPMFESGTGRLFERLRSSALTGRAKTYSVMVVDIGSFTTDIGLVSFTLDEIDDFHRPTVAQVSKAIGVRELDNLVLKELAPEAQAAIKAKAAGEWEGVKRRLYRGEKAAIRARTGGVLQIGTPIEMRKVTSCIEEFAERIKTEVRAFSQDQQVTPDEMIVTGGGAMIARLREAIVKGLSKECAANVTDLLDPEEPRKSLRQIRTPTGWVNDEKLVASRREENQYLIRGASALGGTSVFIDLPPSQASSTDDSPEPTVGELMQSLADLLSVPPTREPSAGDASVSSPTPQSTQSTTANSATGVDVVTEEQNGWVVVRHANNDARLTEHERVANLRTHLTRFFEKRPNLRLASVTSLMVSGTTSELIGIYKRLPQQKH